jgi:hypothetical protein
MACPQTMTTKGKTRIKKMKSQTMLRVAKSIVGNGTKLAVF